MHNGLIGRRGTALDITIQFKKESLYISLSKESNKNIFLLYNIKQYFNIMERTGGGEEGRSVKDG